ncbi:MAG: hypothetical protein A2603_03830 [Bdellovibrionales bacterium RIFOXYD1_FULL_55_31]|nr:MAG: hypothetical protein A2603_03830 [Bdellovibrionales bacterium RIFOXYD1_FULL_55_31]
MALATVLLIVVCLPVYAAMTGLSLASDLSVPLTFITFGAVLVHLAIFFLKKRVHPVSQLLVSVLWVFTLFAVLISWVYREITLSPFSLMFAIRNLSDTYHSLVHVLGFSGLIVAMIACVVLIVLGIRAAQGAQRFLASKLSGVRLTGAARIANGAVFCIGMVLLISSVVRASVLLARDQYGRVRPKSAMPTDLAVTGKADVFILHIEGFNSKYFFPDDGETEKGFHPKVPLPGFKTILENGSGIFFPLFWSNSFPTYRAFETILCGTSGTPGAMVTSLPDWDPKARPCLPRILHEAGYKTEFLSSYYNLSFYDVGSFSRDLGFKNSAYNDQLMKPGDRKFSWGYDDCAFYERAFEHLEAKYRSPDPLFVYLEVSMHHAPFSEPKYPKAHPYPSPRDYGQAYANSVVEQDHCLKTFWERYSRFRRPNSHLFIVPDHSVALEKEFDIKDLFGVSLLYVPPAGRREVFPPGVRRGVSASQAQLVPTILELLNERPYKHSFAFSLRGKERSRGERECHYLSSPFDRLVVKRENETFGYLMNHHKIVRYVYRPDRSGRLRLLSETVENLVPLDRFYELYDCWE